MLYRIASLTEKVREFPHKRPGTTLAVILTTIALGIGTAGFFAYQRERNITLEENATYCTRLIRQADTPETRNFVRNKVTMQEGIYQGKTCKQIFKEYNKK